jgi:hypothetical protein
MLILVLGCLGWANYLTLYVQLSLGEDQISYFAEAVDKATREGKVEQIPTYIVAVQNYYPSGTKQRTGSRVDRVVELARRLAIQQLERLGATNRAGVGRVADATGKAHLAE